MARVGEGKAMNDFLFCLSRLGLSFSLCWLALAIFETLEGWWKQ